MRETANVLAPPSCPHLSHPSVPPSPPVSRPPRFPLSSLPHHRPARHARANCSNAVIVKSSASIKRDSRRSLSPKFQMDYEIRASRMPLIITKPNLVWENYRAVIFCRDIFININKSIAMRSFMATQMSFKLRYTPRINM